MQRSALPLRRAISITGNDKSGEVRREIVARRSLSAAPGYALPHSYNADPGLIQELTGKVGSRVGKIANMACMYRDAVAPGATSAHRRIEPADARQMDQPDHRLPRDHVRDRDTPQRKAPQEIVSAVNRINDPAPLPCLSSALLAEKAVRRKSLGETGANQGLDLAIGNADEILWSFGLARQVFAVGEMSGRELPGLQDQLSGESEAGFDRHGLGRPPDIL